MHSLSWPFVVALASGLASQPEVTRSVKAQRPDMWELKHRVKECEARAAQAQCDLAEARAKLAEAQGKRRVAVAEWGKVVSHYEMQLQGKKGDIPDSFTLKTHKE